MWPETPPNSSFDSDVRRFRDRTDTSGGPDACWPMIAHSVGRRVTESRSAIRVKFQGRMWSAPRLALALEGWVPNELFACHHCDNPLCVNPRHIYAGTAMENAQDTRRRGRLKVFRDHAEKLGMAPAEYGAARVAGVSHAEMARPENLRGGRPQKQDGPTANLPFRVSARRRARYVALARMRGLDTAEMIREVLDAACDAAGVPDDPRTQAD